MPQWWGWEDAWGILILIACSLCIAIGIRAMTADHRVRFYYLQAGSSCTCVMADMDWDSDSTAFCSDDQQKSVAVLEKLNEELRKGSGK